MARIIVKASLPVEVHEAGIKLGVEWGKLLTEIIIAKSSMVMKKERQQATEEQMRVYKDAMVVLTGKIIQSANGEDSFKHPIEYAKVWAKSLIEVGYFTTATELIDDAKKKIAERKN